jgi:hypothetical protein
LTLSIVSFLLPLPPIPPPGHLTWVKVDKPVFDLVGVVLSSFKLAGLVAGVALLLGTLLGLFLILRQRAAQGRLPETPSIRLDPDPGPRPV